MVAERRWSSGDMCLNSSASHREKLWSMRSPRESAYERTQRDRPVSDRRMNCSRADQLPTAQCGRTHHAVSMAVTRIMTRTLTVITIHNHERCCMGERTRPATHSSTYVSRQRSRVSRVCAGRTMRVCQNGGNRQSSPTSGDRTLPFRKSNPSPPPAHRRAAADHAARCCLRTGYAGRSPRVSASRFR